MRWMRFSDCMSWAACCGRLIFEPGSDVRGNDGDFRGNSIGGAAFSGKRHLGFLLSMLEETRTLLYTAATNCRPALTITG